MRFFILIILTLTSLIAQSKSYVQLTDSVTGEVLPFATVISNEGRKKTYIADENGIVSLPEILRHSNLESSYTGYSNKPFVIGIADTIYIVKMAPVEYELEEVYIRPKKEKYSKKNNPAVDFVNKLRRDSRLYSPEKEPYYSYDKYEKTLLAINNFQGQFDSGFYAKRTKFLKNYVDTSSYTGARLLDLILKEKLSSRIVSTNPKADKEIILALKSDGVDEMFEQENVKAIVEDLMREVDIYDPSINLLQNRFVSPLSPLGVDFYKYYLTDTVFLGDEQCIELSFVPRNAQSMGFNGKLYVPIEDSTMFVKKVTMRTPHGVNLNFLKNLYINQSFEKDSIGNRHKTYDDLVVEMQILPGTPEFYARKTTVYDNFSYEPRSDLKDFYRKLGSEFSLVDSVDATAQFWEVRRMVPLTQAESRLGDITKDFRSIPLIYYGEKVIRLLETGYVGTGKPSKFDFGPLNTFLSFSSSQGLKIRLGGMTTAALNPHLFLKGYVAYGTKSREWRYGGTVEYSFNKKKRYSREWPRHGFYASYDMDNDFIGEHYLFTNPDNFFLSFKRKSNNLYTKRRIARGGYVLELRNNFSVEAGITYQNQIGTPNLTLYRTNGTIMPSYQQAFFNISLRWAKGEKFIQGRNNRYSLNNDPWIFQLTQQFGPKGLLGSNYTTNITEFSLQKRLWLSAFGYFDMIVRIGKVWSSVYFPSLLWPNANLSYTIQPESYSLLDPMEFANDQYAALDITYFGNGILFNRIPGINKLKIREAITFKGLMGSLSDKNNPAFNHSLLAFPTEVLAQKMRHTPYMEIGAGIDNILSVLRVDYVWRLSYINTPGVDKCGIRVSFHFTL